jgi:hypothetical protein
MNAWEPPKLEADHARELRAHMEARGWLVEKVHGSMYMKGWPDYYCFHPRFGERWLETKRPEHGHLEPSQEKKFRKWQAFGIKIVIASCVEDYNVVLKGEPNWWKWCKGAPKQWRK